MSAETDYPGAACLCVLLSLTRRCSLQRRGGTVVWQRAEKQEARARAEQDVTVSAPSKGDVRKSTQFHHPQGTEAGTPLLAPMQWPVCPQTSLTPGHDPTLINCLPRAVASLSQALCLSVTVLQPSPRVPADSLVWWICPAVRLLSVSRAGRGPIPMEPHVWESEPRAS